MYLLQECRLDHVCPPLGASGSLTGEYENAIQMSLPVIHYRFIHC